MAPSKPDLMKIGFEGFAMLDEYFAQRGKKHQPQPHLPPSKPDLMKIGFEGFAMLDEYFAQRGKMHQPQPHLPPPQQQQYYVNRSHHQYQPSKPHVYQVIVDYPKTNKKNPMRMA